MASEIQIICNYLQNYLDPSNMQDYCPNGLQIAGKTHIDNIISGVSANQELIDTAIEKNVDLLIVHHGFFWKNESPCITGIKQQRIKKLLNHNINLIAYHLPLDIHPTLGNNIQLANKLKISVKKTFNLLGVDNLGFLGQFEKPITANDCVELITHILNRPPLHIAAEKSHIQTIAWCTGAAQDGIEQAAAQGADAYISGEISERTTSLAKELNIHYFAAGHHATERYGIQALGEYLAKRFSLQHEFVDIKNPA